MVGWSRCASPAGPVRLAAGVPVPLGWSSRWSVGGVSAVDLGVELVTGRGRPPWEGRSELVEGRLVPPDSGRTSHLGRSVVHRRRFASHVTGISREVRTGICRGVHACAVTVRVCLDQSAPLLGIGCPVSGAPAPPVPRRVAPSRVALFAGNRARSGPGAGMELLAGAGGYVMAPRAHAEGSLQVSPASVRWMVQAVPMAPHSWHFRARAARMAHAAVSSHSQVPAAVRSTW